MKEQKEKGNGLGFLRWPWNAVIYVLLAVVLRLFAIPVILLLMWVQRKNNPHGAAEGYCLSRTRKKLTWLIWGGLCLVVAVCLGAVFAMGLGQDRAYWETMDYVTLAVSGGGAVLLGLLGIWLCYVAVRDACFPEKSTLAQSIRSQLPYPEEAPPVEELFAMVDGDLKEHGQWFGPVGIGREWVLGDGVNRIDRIRGIFVVNELHQHRTETGVRTRREMELVLIDDRWQRTGTGFNNLNDLKAAADCLALRVPEARRGSNGQNLDFWTMEESQREDFEREFRQKRNLRASEAARQAALQDQPQDMIFQDGAERTSRVTGELVEARLRQYLAAGAGAFSLIPTRPLPAGEQLLRELRAAVRGGRVLISVVSVPFSGGVETNLECFVEEEAALEILRGWLRRQAPDVTDWSQGRVNAPDDRGGTVEQPQRESRAKLYLVRSNGLSETHTAFTGEDVEVAAEGLVDGTYQTVELTHPVGYLWIRVLAGDRMDGRCTVEATRPDADSLRFFRTKMPPRQAAAWLTGYPHGEYLPGGTEWKDFTKQVK